MISIRQLLTKYWNHQEFRDPQEDIINAVINHENVLTLLPTGAGKSLCFQIPALAKNGICIVISPLIALMEDQVNSLQKKGIKAIALTSKFHIEDTIKLFDNLRYGNYKFLYLSPEKLQSEFIQNKIGQLKVNLIAIDEAHCISQWGHDFRPAYLKISILKEIHPQSNIIALTASATSKVADDIVKYLGLTDVRIFKKSFSRSNLSFRIYKTENALEKLKQILLKNKEPSIVYTNTRKSCIEISNYLNYNGFVSNYYHGGLQNKDKLTAYTNWTNENCPIMVATNAFGMGIDKKNVRTVIHMNIPNSLENYMQEVGRAGRDGIASYVCLIYNESTIFDTINYLNKGIADPKYYKKVYNNLHQHYQIAKGELSERTYELNLSDFCFKYKLSFLKTSYVLNSFDLESIIDIQKNDTKKSAIKIIVSNSYLFEYEKNNKDLYTILKVILRNYGGLFEQFIHINEGFIGKKLNISKSKVIESLIQLDLNNILIYKRAKGDIILKFLVPREDNFVINGIAPNILRNNKIKVQKVNAIVDYIQNNKICRNIQLQSYFGESNVKKCNICDVCRKNIIKKLKINFEIIADEILDLFKTNQILSFEELEIQLKYEKKYIIKTLQLLIEKNTLRLTSLNKIEKVKNE